MKKEQDDMGGCGCGFVVASFIGATLRDNGWGFWGMLAVIIPIGLLVSLFFLYIEERDKEEKRKEAIERQTTNKKNVASTENKSPDTTSKQEMHNTQFSQNSDVENNTKKNQSATGDSKKTNKNDELPWVVIKTKCKVSYILFILVLLAFSGYNALCFYNIPDNVEKEVSSELDSSREQLRSELKHYADENHLFLIENDTRFIPLSIREKEIRKRESENRYRREHPEYWQFFSDDDYKLSYEERISYDINWDSCHWRYAVSVFKDDTWVSYIIAPTKIKLSNSVSDEDVMHTLQTINKLEFQRYYKSDELSNMWFWDLCDSINSLESKHHEILNDTTYQDKITNTTLQHKYKGLGVAYTDSLCTKWVYTIKLKKGSNPKTLIKERVYERKFSVIARQIIGSIIVIVLIIIVFRTGRNFVRKRIDSEYDSIDSKAKKLFEEESKRKVNQESVYISQEVKSAVRNLLCQYNKRNNSWEYKKFCIVHKQEIVDFYVNDKIYTDVNKFKQTYLLGFNEYTKKNKLVSDLSKWPKQILLNICSSNDVRNEICELDNSIKLQNEYKRIENEYQKQILYNMRRAPFVKTFLGKKELTHEEKAWIVEHVSELDSFINKTIADFTSRMALSYPLGYEHYMMYFGKTLRNDFEILNHENDIREKHAILVEWEKLKLSHPEGKIEIAKNHTIESLITPEATYGLYDKNILNISKITAKLQNLPITYKSDAYNISKLLKDNGVDCLFHFTDIRNIPLIKDLGGLCSWDFLYKNNVNIPFQGGDNESMRYDKSYGLEDYVRLSFCQSHPMEHRLRQMGANLVVLRISVEVAKFTNTLFSNMNAADSRHTHGGQLSDLSKVNFNATKTGIIGNDDVNFKLRQAEVMVKTFIPSDLILNFSDI